LVLLAMAMDLYPIADALDRIAGRWFSFLWVGQIRLEVVALFLPGAIRRLNWRHAIILAATGFGSSWIAMRWGVHLFPYSMLSWDVLLIALVEWILDTPRRPRALVWTMAFAVAITCVLPTLEPLTWHPFWLPTGTGRRMVYASYLVYWPLVSVLTWLAIPAARRVATQPDHPGDRLAVCGTVLSVAWFMIFFHWIVYGLSLRSLSHGWPVDRKYALSILQTRRNPTDDAAIWQSLQSADWSQSMEGEEDQDDYRRRGIQALAEHDLDGTAARLSALLRTNPTPLLAGDAASVLASVHHYDAAPELMRYALLNPRWNEAREALESMAIPQAALAVMREQAIIRADAFGMRETLDSTISPSAEQRLTRLLGKDVGPKWGDWTRLYDSSVDECPTPLSASQKLEVDRVTRAVITYWETSDRVFKAGAAASILPPNFDAPGTAALEEETRKYCAAANAKLAK
jgi:hypothetical protein